MNIGDMEEIFVPPVGGGGGNGGLQSIFFNEIFSRKILSKFSVL